MAARLVFVVVLVAAAGCSRSPSAAPPSATVGTEPPRTTTTDPYAVPDIIDEAYVNRVLAEFDRIRGDVIRLAMQTKTIPPEALDRYKSLYGTGVYLQINIDLLQDQLRKGFSDYRANPGNRRTTVERLISVNRSCIFAQVKRDASEVAAPPVPPPSRAWVVLVPDPGDVDPWKYNPTPWYMRYDGFDPGHQAPADPCSEK